MTPTKTHKAALRPRTAEPTAEPGVWLTAEEAADYLRCSSYKAFWEWQKRHGVASARRGRRLLFARRDLDRAIGALHRRPV